MVHGPTLYEFAQPSQSFKACTAREDNILPYSGWCEERDKFQFYRPGVERLLGNYEQTVKGKIGANPELTKKVA